MSDKKANQGEICFVHVAAAVHMVRCALFPTISTTSAIPDFMVEQFLP